MTAEAIPQHGQGTAAADPTALVAFVRRHPLITFFAWFFTVGQAFVFAPLFFEFAIADQWFINGSTVFGLLLPVVVITGMVDGRQGLRDLGRRIATVRVSAGVAAVGLIAMPVIAIGMAWALLGAPAGSASASITAIGSVLLVSTAVGFVLNNLWEEVAWMGFVQARLQTRRGPLLAAVITAPLFALQHIALIVENEAVTAVVIMALFMVFVIPYRAFAGWMYNRTGGSLFLVGLVHALGNAVAPGSGLFGGYLREMYPADGELVGVLHIAAFAVVGLIVMAVTRGRLGVDGRRASPVDPAPVLGENPVQ